MILSIEMPFLNGLDLIPVNVGLLSVAWYIMILSSFFYDFAVKNIYCDFWKWLDDISM